jgi:hypothetical protein
MTAEDALKAIEQHTPTNEDNMNNIHLPNPNAIQYTHGGTLGAPEPQPSAEVLHNPDLPTIINNICTQLQLLATVISQTKGNPQTESQSLQECVALTLQQADWFKEMVRGIVDDTYDFADYAKDAVEDVVESHVDTYFSNQFDPTDHFDFGDAVQDAVSDQIDGVVSDKMDDALEEYMSGATITISK